MRTRAAWLLDHPAFLGLHLEAKCLGHFQAAFRGTALAKKWGVRALLIGLVLALGTPALADPSPLYVRAVPARIETPAPRTPKPVVLKLAMREPEERPLPERTVHPDRPSLMDQLRDRICEQLPVVSTAVVAPLPISSADGTLAGVGVLGRF